jgi:hypothetical protein
MFKIVCTHHEWDMGMWNVPKEDSVNSNEYLLYRNRIWSKYLAYGFLQGNEVFNKNIIFLISSREQIEPLFLIIQLIMNGLVEVTNIIIWRNEILCLQVLSAYHVMNMISLL